MNQDNFRKLISGQSTGLGARLLCFLLGVAAKGYSAATQLRNFSYSRGLLNTHRAEAAVISVGNITTGGTGKTPLVIWICNLITQNSKLKNKNYKCAVLTRGYKATQNSKLKTQNYGDEPAIFAESCPETRIIINPDRVAGAAEAVNKFGAEVLVMDDGFQHRRLGRDLDIVTIDATQPFGYDKMLPAGLLREPLTTLQRADAVVITRCDQTTEAKLTQIEEKLRQINGDIIIARSMHAPVCAKSTNDKEIGLEELKDKKIFGFCGIGNPAAFLNTIKALGYELVGSKVYNDHHHYTDDCLADICKQAEHCKADLILTTQKDWTKITALAPGKKDIPLACLVIEIKFLAGKDKLTGLIEETLASKIQKKLKEG